MAEHLDREARALSLALLCAAGRVAAFRTPTEGRTDGHDAWVVEVTASNTRFLLFVDRTSLMPLKVAFRTNEPGVEDEPRREIEIRVAGHRAVQGVLLPTRITRSVDGIVQTDIETETFLLDATPPGAFARPAPE